MKQYILALVLAVVSASVAFAVNPIKEGNMISGHVIVKGTEENIPYATIRIISYNGGSVPDKYRASGAVSNDCLLYTSPSPRDCS